ncbi:unnamed protein product [Brassica oleracea]
MILKNITSLLQIFLFPFIKLITDSKSTGEVLERWNFRIETDSEVVEKGSVVEFEIMITLLEFRFHNVNLDFFRVSREKSDKEIMREFQATMRQVASSITYLPCLDEPCVFDVHIYGHGCGCSIHLG